MTYAKCRQPTKPAHLIAPASGKDYHNHVRSSTPDHPLPIVIDVDVNVGRQTGPSSWNCPCDRLGGDMKKKDSFFLPLFLLYFPLFNLSFFLFGFDFLAPLATHPICLITSSLTTRLISYPDRD